VGGPVRWRARGWDARKRLYVDCCARGTAGPSQRRSATARRSRGP